MQYLYNKIYSDSANVFIFSPFRIGKYLIFCYCYVVCFLSVLGTETSSFDKHATTNNNPRFSICSTPPPPKSDNSGKPNNFMSSSLFEPKVNGTSDGFMLSRSDTYSNLKE
ncbi:uncharacterized protein DC041_0009977 [Schistosoma bovis]|uniref:Uncharacterized protein n=1 Tax=Schistosoma bovis TaxID=6184 RepID=A0A430QGT5_SCHBO|nr:uncharacterized protein DC041_0009977 [Schistosoma bovis]